jgi:hypothetical protein
MLRTPSRDASAFNIKGCKLFGDAPNAEDKESRDNGSVVLLAVTHFITLSARRIGWHASICQK